MTNPQRLYLELMKKALTGLLWDEARLWAPVDFSYPQPLLKKVTTLTLRQQLAKSGKAICEPIQFDRERRYLGRDWPTHAQTMIGMRRLDNLQTCIESVICDAVPGDLIETGVWRGGATIFMRAVLKAYDVSDRTVWVADSFEGLPPPNEIKYPKDKEDKHHGFGVLRVSLEEVKQNFERYGLLDEQVHFLKGWFNDSLPEAPITKLAVARLDGDMYESTWDALSNLYSRLSPGGYLIIDDYNLPGCRAAVHDYRSRYGITDEIIDIDGWGAYWRISVATV